MNPWYNIVLKTKSRLLLLLSRVVWAKNIGLYPKDCISVMLGNYENLLANKIPERLLSRA